MPRLLLLCFGRSALEGSGCAGGEYCVPASTVGFIEEELEMERLCGFGLTGGDCKAFRGKAAGGGGLMYGRGECVVEKR